MAVNLITDLFHTRNFDINHLFGALLKIHLYSFAYNRNLNGGKPYRSLLISSTMKMGGDVLTVFPTELAKRRYERRRVLASGVLDTSRLFTQKKLLTLCERAARRAGLLNGRSPGQTELRLLLEEAAGNVAFAPGQPLARLSPGALTGLLEQAIETFAVFAENEPILIQWLLAHESDHKLHGIGQLLTAWRKLCTKMDIADRFAVNTALLRLIESGDLPCELDGDIHFRAVRWFNPFEERFAAALKNRRLSISDCRVNDQNHPEIKRPQSSIENPQSKILIYSVLPGAHAEASEDRLCAVVRSELERGNEEEWKPWLEDFADAFEADDSNILESESRERVSFFVSAHPYGEIEDAARRIAKEIEAGTPPDEIALILRDLSPYTDIVPDVFQRFGIPYHFRRGTPAAAHPPVKALLALLAFPQTFSRDRLCDLLLMPGIQWPGVEDREALVRELRLKEPPRLRRLPKELSGFFQKLEFGERIQFIIQQHGLQLPEEAHNLINELGAVRIEALSIERMISLFEELLDNVTLKDEFSTESGVWVINVMDAAGLRFESVYLAGMDDRTFPQVPKADSLLNTIERKALKKFLTEQNIFCPRLALSEAGEALIQEEILFLTAMSAARERLTLSYTRTGADGKEHAPGEFFERMRGLTGIEKPELGESFHTILPPEFCRAEDEVRQTAAFQRRTGFQPVPESNHGQAGSLSYIQKWLEDNPEFSATALESLARNRFVFFLEKVLSIKPDRTHEDDIDPIDRGSLIHDILEQVYTAIAKQNGLYATKVSNHWKLSQSGEILLAVFDPAKSDELLALARGIAEEEFRKAERRPSRHLGHPAIWETEKRKIRQMVENFIQMDIETALAENRYPAMFEMKFDQKHDLPVTLYNVGQASSLSAPEEGQAGSPSYVDSIRLKGKIDRIDLIFDANGELERLLVVDYKSKSRGVPVSQLEKEIGLNLDCQIPLYTFAAQEKFFGAHNTPELNEKVQAVYHLQERDLKEMTKHFTKKRLTMTPELTETFLETLFSNVRKLRAGDLAAEPLIAGYEDYSHICRTTAIDPKELLRGA
jgi:RecB family exonuclease